MALEREVDVCIIGGGSAGLSAAAGAAQMGAKTVLFEKGKMGGDCLNDGCVPSKSLLAAGKAAQARKHASAFGIKYRKPAIDFAAVHDHVHDVIAGIAPHDSVERFEGLGVSVVQAEARFVGPQTLESEGQLYNARRILVATGSEPFIPPIPGLDTVDYLTNETVFDLTSLPDHLIVVGGGPIGCELGQAFCHLGAAVSVVEMATVLPKDDPELADVVRQQLVRDGIKLYEESKVIGVEKLPDGLAVDVETKSGTQRIEGSALLLAVGRRPNTAGLNLEAAGVQYDRSGIKVDSRLRSTNHRVFAAGDVAGGFQFTHLAGHHAGIFIRNALFRLPARVDNSAVPWVTFTEPELAHVGLDERSAKEKHGDIRILRWPFAENDRARAERLVEGGVKAIVTPRGRILGATIVGSHAGELIQTWVLAISQGLKIGAVAQMIAPYPTLGEVSKRAAGGFFTPKLFSERTRSMVQWLAKIG